MNKFSAHGFLGVLLVSLLTLTLGIDQALAKTYPALAATGNSAGKAENAEGIAHYKEGHWKVAAKHFKAAVGADMDLAVAHYNYALTLDKMGQHKEATEHFGHALKLGKDNPEIADSEILKAHLGMK